MLNEGDVFVFRHQPGKRKHIYNYHFGDSQGPQVDSLIRRERIIVHGDSLAAIMAEKFMGDSMFIKMKCANIGWQCAGCPAVFILIEFNSASVHAR
ncbi:MAG: hypothetical protein HC830_14840 [Bacteroidetes bacterium]|nr:hypothetical protein [Bacteroidota bacterium]